MSSHRNQEIVIVRRTVNQLNADILNAQLEKIVGKSIGQTFRKFGWRGTHRVAHESDTTGHTYTATLHYSKRQRRERDNSQEVFEKQLGEITRKVLSGSRSSGWTMKGEQAEAVQSVVRETEAADKQRVEIVIPAAYEKFFAHIFDRDAQIRVVYQAIQAARASNFTKRNHCLLWGKPACGKTEILLAIERMLGSDSVIKLDATMTTKAGAENLLLEMDNIPPVMILEEAEKCNPANLPWLLGVLDQRGEIIKTNARVGSIRKEARCLCLATVNNLAEFQTIMAGALASRFQHKVYCPRPTRAVLEKILSREVAEMHGNPEWIAPAIDYCVNVEKTDDPRRVIAVLDGRDRLLSGEYQKDLRSIYDAMQKDGAEPPKN